MSRPIAGPPAYPPSWSTLSPLAPPFTVDRPLAPTTNPSPPPPTPPAHAHYLLPRGASNQNHLHLRRPSSPPSDAAYPWPTSSSASASAQDFHAPPGRYDRSSSSSSSILASSRSMPSSSVVKAAPYYPYYAPAIGGTPAATDDALGPLPDSGGRTGIDLAHWNPFDGVEGGRFTDVDLSSSSMDSSSMFKVSTFHKGNASEGFVLGDDSWGSWHGKLVDSTVKNVHFQSDCSEWLDGKNPAIFEEHVRAPCKKFGTPASHTTALHKRTPYSHSLGPFSMMEERNAYNSNSYDEYIAQLASCSADPMIYHPDIRSSSQAYAPLIRGAGSSVDCSMSANTFSNTQHEDPFKVNDNHVDCLMEVKSGLKITHLTLPNSFTSGSGPAKPDDSAQTSSETLDQLNLVVDSPCWKGAPASRQCPFDVDEAVDLYSLANDSKGCGGNLVQKHLLVSAFSPISSLREDESLNCIEADEKGSYCANVRNEETQCSNIPAGQSNPEPKECYLKQLRHDGGFVSVDRPIFTGETNLEAGLNVLARDSSSGPADNVEIFGSSDPARKCTPHGEDVQVLVKALHVLSEMLLITRYGDGDVDELKEHDHELVQLVIDNLNAFILKGKKVTTKHSSLVDGLETAQSINQNNKSTQMKGKLHCIEYAIYSDKLASEGVAEDPGRSSDMAQVFQKALEASSHEQEENPQILLYRNLWIEAEAALCSLKYELQLARLKLEMENHKKQAKDAAKKPAQEERSSSLNYMHALDGRDLLKYKVDKSSCYGTSALGIEADKRIDQKSQEADTKRSEIDASVMARFRVLKGRHEKSSSSVEDGQELTLEISHPVDEHDTRLIVPLKRLVGLGCMERNQQPCTEAEPRGGSSEHATARESRDCTADGLLNELYLRSSGKGEHVPSCGYDSPSSEWEHVIGSM